MWCSSDSKIEQHSTEGVMNNPQFSCYFNTTFILFSPWKHSHMHALLWLKSSIHHSLFADFITWSWLRARSQLDNDLFYTIAENVLYTGRGASTIWAYILHLRALKERKPPFHCQKFPCPTFKDEEVHEGSNISHHTPHIVSAILVHYYTFCFPKKS